MLLERLLFLKQASAFRVRIRLGIVLFPIPSSYLFLPSNRTFCSTSIDLIAGCLNTGRISSGLTPPFRA